MSFIPYTLPGKQWLQQVVEPGDCKWAEAIRYTYAHEPGATNTCTLGVSSEL